MAAMIAAGLMAAIHSRVEDIRLRMLSSPHLLSAKNLDVTTRRVAVP